MDLTALRSQTVSVCILPPGLAWIEQVAACVAPLLFRCPVLVGGEPCALRLSSVVGVVRHARIAHKLAHWARSLVVANVCPWCASSFITKKDAKNHLTGPLVSGLCVMLINRCTKTNRLRLDSNDTSSSQQESTQRPMTREGRRQSTVTKAGSSSRC